MSLQSEIVVQSLPRLISITSKEVKDLGYKEINSGTKEIFLKGSMEDCMQLNLHLRTASSVLFKIMDFKCPNPDALYNAVKSFAWEQYLYRDEYISIDSFVRNPAIKDHRFANVRVKDGIVDRFYQQFGRRPDSGSEKNHVVIFLHWVDEKATLYFDTSGQTLAKHGYRKDPFQAPVIESLAAAIILSTQWNPQMPLLNPMCGSGTLAIEAALIARKIAPGLLRDNFAFMHLKHYEAHVWKKMLREAKKQIDHKNSFFIIASDHQREAIEAAKRNALNAGVIDDIQFVQADFREIEIPSNPGVIIMNPPYGERIGELNELERLYVSMGNFLKQQCTGYIGYVFSGNLELAKKLGLKPTKKMEFYNARIDCRLYEYPLYEGTEK